MSEIAPQNLRGLLGTVNALAICVGNLVANVIGLPELLGGDRLWPYLMGLMLIPCFVHLIGLPFCSPSPKYLFITKSDKHKTKQGIAFFF